MRIGLDHYADTDTIRGVGEYWHGTGTCTSTSMRHDQSVRTSRYPQHCRYPQPSADHESGEELSVCRDDEALEVVRVVGEEVVSVFGHGDRVGMPESAHLGVVEAWLDGENHAGLQRRGVSHVDERRLVHSKAGTVSHVLAPVACEAVLLEVGVHRAVDVGAGGTRNDRVERRLARCEHVVEEPAHPVGRLADHHRAFQLCVVAPDGRARLAYENLAGLESDVVRDGVSPGAAVADLAPVACFDSVS